MAEITLEVSRRERVGKEFAKKLRREGKIPAVVYGAHKDPVSITVDRKSVADLISKSDHGIRSIFLLKMAGTDQQRHAMIKDLQIDPISRRMTHVDFVRILMDEVVRVAIPIHISGLALGVRASGGLLDFQVRELHVECLPNAIPDEIAVDVSNLDLHQYIRISDLPIPEGVKVLDDMDRVVVGVSVPRAEVVAEEVATTEPVEPELIKKGKTEEPEEEEKKK